MLNYSKNKNNEPLFRIPIDQIEQAYWVDISEVKPPGKLLGKDNLINKISEEMQEKRTYRFEVQLKSDYENLHLLNNVNCALQRHSKFKQQPHAVKKKILSRRKVMKNNWSAQDISLNLSKLQFASPISVSAAPRRYNPDPIHSSIIKVSTGNVKLSVERSNSKVDPTEIVISRVISARNKKANNLLSNSFAE